MVIKNQLIKVLFKDESTDLIQDLIIYTNENYRPYDPGQYLYNLITNVPFEEKFTDSFIELVYTTLIAWNMNQRGAKLSEFEVFKKSILENQKNISLLRDYRIERLSQKDLIKERLESLFNNLQLVDKNKPKLVTFSKTMHFLLPHLLMPIDHSYTLQFFYRNTNFEKDEENQIKIYFEILDQFIQLAVKYDFTKYIDHRWNRNIPKIIDNTNYCLHNQTT
jgi:hypothetical protein